MITTQLSDLNPMVESGIVCQIETPTVPTVIAAAAQDFCFCEFECQYVELAFALVGGTSFQNDKSAFVRQRVLVADTIEFQLFKNGEFLTTLIDDTYGEFFDFGAHPTQVNVKAFRVHWEKVFNLEGGGQYQIKVAETITGVSSVFEFRLFRLRRYDVEAVHKTVRVETVQNGSINGGPEDFDYTGMEWENMFRIPGTLGPRIPTMDNDGYVDGNLEKTQITTTIENSYKLTTLLIPREVVDLLIYNTFVANRIFVTDYNIFSTHNLGKGTEIIYNRIPVEKDEIEEPKGFRKSQKELHVVIFVDKDQGTRKRNFQ